MKTNGLAGIGCPITSEPYRTTLRRQGEGSLRYPRPGRFTRLLT